MATDPKRLGRAIRNLRLLRELTQSQVAARMEVSVNFLSQLENGKRGISRGPLDRLSAILDVPPAFIHCLAAEAKGRSEKSSVLRSIQGEIRSLLEFETRNARGYRPKGAAKRKRTAASKR